MRTGLTKQEKTTDIWFDEKDPLIHIRTHNTDLKKRLAAYAGQHPDQCRQTDADPDTGCMEFEIRNSQLARRWVLTIPREIPPDQYAVLVRESITVEPAPIG